MCALIVYATQIERQKLSRSTNTRHRERGEVEGKDRLTGRLRGGRDGDKRQRERQTDRQGDRQTDRQTDRDRERQRERVVVYSLMLSC